MVTHHLDVRTYLLLITVTVASQVCCAEVSVSKLFCDHAVLQREEPIKVWGWAAPGEKVSVRFKELSESTTADNEGRWRVLFKPLPAGGPHELVITGSNVINIKDVYVGDVWIASGQSNMEWLVADSMNADREIAAADDRLIRHFKVPRSSANRPQSKLAGGKWQVADSERVGSFSAAAFYFARSLRSEIEVPIGIINASWGGSRIEPWMSLEALGVSSDQLDELLEQDQQQVETLERELAEKCRASLIEDLGLKDGVANWADPKLDDSDWDKIRVPKYWEMLGYSDLDGVAWYRTTVELTKDQIESDQFTLHLGKIDDDDRTWVNGILVGQIQGWTIPRAYRIPQGVLHAGKNTIAIRVEDGSGNGGMGGPVDDIRLKNPDFSIPLAGIWKFRIGKVAINSEERTRFRPTLMYNKMIHPLVPFPVKGFLWYQGESNAQANDAVRYAEQFTALITSWREAWKAPATPFLFVQLANFGPVSAEPEESDWAVLRESQQSALALPNVGQAVAIDIGEAADIHPRNKQEVGRRLALAARNIAYGEDLVHAGPIYRAHHVKNGRVVIEFDHVGSGLVAKGAELNGFSLEGTNGKQVWADAAIVENTVVVSHETVANPKTVRYAWASNPQGANLYNREGLPAAPFRLESLSSEP